MKSTILLGIWILQTAKASSPAGSPQPEERYSESIATKRDLVFDGIGEGAFKNFKAAMSFGNFFEGGLYYRIADRHLPPNNLRDLRDYINRVLNSKDMTDEFPSQPNVHKLDVSLLGFSRRLEYGDQHLAILKKRERVIQRLRAGEDLTDEQVLEAIKSDFVDERPECEAWKDVARVYAEALLWSRAVGLAQSKGCSEEDTQVRYNLLIVPAGRTVLEARIDKAAKTIEVIKVKKQQNLEACLKSGKSHARCIWDDSYAIPDSHQKQFEGEIQLWQTRLDEMGGIPLDGNLPVVAYKASLIGHFSMGVRRGLTVDNKHTVQAVIEYAQELADYRRTSVELQAAMTELYKEVSKVITGKGPLDKRDPGTLLTERNAEKISDEVIATLIEKARQNNMECREMIEQVYTVQRGKIDAKHIYTKAYTTYSLAMHEYHFQYGRYYDAMEWLQHAFTSRSITDLRNTIYHDLYTRFNRRVAEELVQLSDEERRGKDAFTLLIGDVEKWNGKNILLARETRHERQKTAGYDVVEAALPRVVEASTSRVSQETHHPEDVTNLWQNRIERDRRGKGANVEEKTTTRPGKISHNWGRTVSDMKKSPLQPTRVATNTPLPPTQAVTNPPPPPTRVVVTNPPPLAKPQPPSPANVSTPITSGPARVPIPTQPSSQVSSESMERGRAKNLWQQRINETRRPPHLK